MADSHLERREASLVRAGLTVLGLVPAGGAVTPETAWRRIVGLHVRPTAAVPFSRDDHLAEVDGHWRRQAEALGVLSPDSSFLISTPGPGAMAAPWTIVRLGAGTGLARHLAPHPGEPEFVTLARDGRALCGVTSEEHDVWVIGIGLTAG